MLCIHNVTETTIK